MPDIGTDTVAATQAQVTQVAIPETPIQKLQDKVSRFLDILRVTLPNDSRLKILDRFDDNPTTTNFAAAFRALERAMGSSNFRRTATAANLIEANSLYQDMLTDLGVKGSTSRFTLGRSAQLREQYEALDKGKDVSIHCAVDARTGLAGTVGRNAFSCTESTTLATKLGLPVDMIMNPTGAGYDQAILSLILRTTTDSKTYNDIPVLDENNKPKVDADGKEIRFSYADLVKKNPGQFTVDEYHAIMQAFRAKTGISNTYPTLTVDGIEQVNQPLIDFFTTQARSRGNYDQRTTMLTAVEFLKLGAQRLANDINSDNPNVTNTVSPTDSSPEAVPTIY